MDLVDWQLDRFNRTIEWFMRTLSEKTRKAKERRLAGRTNDALAISW